MLSAVLIGTLLLGGKPTLPCAYDRARMLRLDQRAFDQDMNGGWRMVAQRAGCELAAANLIRDYRQVHRSDPRILFWHEGQLRAQAGQKRQALALFEGSREPGDDPFGWNPYVDATMAFLRQDRAGLLAARERLLKQPRPADWNPRGPDGQPLAMPWPMNLNVVDGLIACFGRPYAEAYGKCSRPLLRVPVQGRVP